MHFKQPGFMAAAAVIATLSTSVNAHMKMKSPRPFNEAQINNSPLAGDGSDYPCKFNAGTNPDAYKSTDEKNLPITNVMAIGDTQTLSFIGSAVHGGGSCQVSLTTDLQPNKDSKWMVIKSIEGGCPSDAAGNLPADPNGNGASSFEYTIPEGIAPGEYTIAWSWINKIGNREFYMNCGPATITAQKKKRYAPVSKVRRQTTFPEMFVANIAGVNTCTTPEGFDYIYPNAGDDVQSAAANAGSYTKLACGAADANAPAATPTATAAAGGSGAAPASSAHPTSVANGSGSGAGSAVSSSLVVPTAGSPGVFASGAASGSAPATTSVAVAPIPSAPAPATSSAVAASPAPASPSEAAPAAPAGTGSTGSSGSSSNVAGTACSNEGAWSCAADGRSYQRCASGRWSVSMSMAAGMKCTPGTSDNISMSPGKVKRHGHDRRSHNFLHRSSH